jgi:hypothetical protein
LSCYLYNLVYQDLPPKYEEVAELPPQYNPSTMPPQYDPTTMPATVAIPPINNNTQGMHWKIVFVLMLNLIILKIQDLKEDVIKRMMALEQILSAKTEGVYLKSQRPFM